MKKLILSALALFCAGSAFAIPAYHGLITKQLPNGSPTGSRSSPATATSSELMVPRALQSRDLTLLKVESFPGIPNLLK